MEVYKNFSKVYDIFMKDAPYEKWTIYIQNIFKKFKVNPKIICELGCGTGNMTIRLAKKNFSLIGIDISDDMLAIAKNKIIENNIDNILFLNQNMCNFKLVNKVDCFICICDGLNYILNEKDLLNVFKSVFKYLNKDGLFIFDLNTIYKFKHILGQNDFCETTDYAAYTWENYYDEKLHINEFYTNFFIKCEKLNLYERFEEIHYQKAYSIEKVKNLIKQSGLTLLNIFDDLNFNPPKNTSERIFFVIKN